MTSLTQTASSDPLIRAAGGFAIVSGIISAIGVVCLFVMFILFATPFRELGLTFGLLNDICGALQYLLTIPIAIALYRILLSYNPRWIRGATIVGIASMLTVVVLQLALIFKLMTIQQQGLWVALAIFVGVGAWLLITGLVARSTGRLPNSVMMSSIAVPYVGYPIWAFWLGLLLLRW